MTNQISTIQNYDPTQDHCYRNEHDAITHVFLKKAAVCCCKQMKLDTYVICGKICTTVSVNK